MRERERECICVGILEKASENYTLQDRELKRKRDRETYRNCKREWKMIRTEYDKYYGHRSRLQTI